MKWLSKHTFHLQLWWSCILLHTTPTAECFYITPPQSSSASSSSSSWLRVSNVAVVGSTGTKNARHYCSLQNGSQLSLTQRHQEQYHRILRKEPNIHSTTQRILLRFQSLSLTCCWVQPPQDEEKTVIPSTKNEVDSIPIQVDDDNHNKTTIKDTATPAKSTTSMSLRDMFEKQEENDRKVLERILWPQRIGKLINIFAIAIILSSFALNMIGYDFIIRDGKVAIDTREARQFLKEINRINPTNHPSNRNSNL